MRSASSCGVAILEIDFVLSRKDKTRPKICAGRREIKVNGDGTGGGARDGMVGSPQVGPKMLNVSHAGQRGAAVSAAVWAATARGAATSVTHPPSLSLGCVPLSGTLRPDGTSLPAIYTTTGISKDNGGGAVLSVRHIMDRSL